MTSQQEPIKSVKPHKGFTLDYLDHNQRDKIVKHLEAGKTFKCHHPKCNSFINNEEFSTLYEYNVHCHTTHKTSPLHPELSLIKLLILEPVGNPWEPDSSAVTIIIEETEYKKSKNQRDEIAQGLDFLLLHFNQDRLFPRKIQTHNSKGKQIEVFSKEEALNHYEGSYFIDCRCNAFPSYTRFKDIQRYPPDFIFIDLDRNSKDNNGRDNFANDKQFENALSKTLKNIKNKLGSDIEPTVNNSGNGYHIVLPIECPILEQIPQLEKYKDKGFFLSQEFLRFAEKYLTNGKSDPNHHPSFKSCQIRVPGSINGRCLENREKRLSDNFKVKTLQKWNGVRPLVTREFIEDFRTYLEQKITDQEINNYNYKKNNNNHYSNNNRIEWIDKKIIANPFSDHRKIIINLILAPYLVVIKKLSYEESYQIINEWLQKCDLVSGRKLDFNARSFVNTALTTAYKKQIPPMKMITLKTNYKDLYFIFVQKEKEERVG